MDRFIAALLSHRMRVEDGCSKPMLAIKFLSQINSFAALNAAVYLASQEDVAMVFCFLAFHKMRPDPSMKPYPPILLLVSRQFAQSESVKPMSLIGLFPPRASLRSLVPLRY